MYSSPHESLFHFRPQATNQSDRSTEERGANNVKGTHGQPGSAIDHDNNNRRDIDTTNVLAGGKNSSFPRHSVKNNGGKSPFDASTSSNNGLDPNRPQSMLTYAGRGFDSRRMCGPCTEELRGAVISSGHELELWHTVDHERRALLTEQRRGDVFKARWAEHEQQDRQVRQALRLAPGVYWSTRVHGSGFRGALYKLCTV